MIQGKPAPLDYDVESPRIIPLNMSDDSPKYLGRFDHVPVFGEYPPNRNKQRGVIEAEYGDYLKDSYTLRELISYFEKFVALIIKTADSLQKPDLRDWERTALLDNIFSEFNKAHVVRHIRSIVDPKRFSHFIFNIYLSRSYPHQVQKTAY